MRVVSKQSGERPDERVEADSQESEEVASLLSGPVLSRGNRVASGVAARTAGGSAEGVAESAISRTIRSAASDAAEQGAPSVAQHADESAADGDAQGERGAARNGPEHLAGVVFGEILGADPAGRPAVVWPQGPAAGMAAAVVWMREPPDWAACRGLRAVLGFEDGDPARPVVLGLLDEPPAVALRPAAAREDEQQGEAPDARPKPESLRIESGKELVLECGEAKIVLRADGSVTLLGVKVVSRARGVNKIKGASVQIN